MGYSHLTFRFFIISTDFKKYYNHQSSFITMGGTGSGRRRGTKLSRQHIENITATARRNEENLRRDRQRQEQIQQRQFVALCFNRNNASTNNTTNNNSDTDAVSESESVNTNDVPENLVQEESVGDQPRVVNPTPIVANLDAPGEDDPVPDDADDVLAFVLCWCSISGFCSQSDIVH